LNNIDLSSDEISFQKADENAIWIYKPAAMNCGKGITLITDLHKFKEEYFQARKNHNFKAQNKNIARPNVRRQSTKQTLPLISTKFAIQQGNEKKKATSTDVHHRKIREETEENVKENENGRNDKPYTLLKRGVIQKYLERPLLLDGRKFDYR